MNKQETSGIRVRTVNVHARAGSASDKKTPIADVVSMTKTISMPAQNITSPNNFNILNSNNSKLQRISPVKEKMFSKLDKLSS